MLTGAEISSIVFVLGVIWGTLILVWTTSRKATTIEMRVAALESAHMQLVPAIEDLRRAVVKLDKHIAVSNARASQGQFGDESDRPPRT